jgi:hypothetical protein
MYSVVEAATRECVVFRKSTEEICARSPYCVSKANLDDCGKFEDNRGPKPMNGREKSPWPIE